MNANVAIMSLCIIRRYRRTRNGGAGAGLAWLDVIGRAGLAMSVPSLAAEAVPARAGLPFFSLRSEPAAGRFKAAVAPRGGRPSLPAQGRPAGPRRSKPAGPQTCPAGLAGSDL